MLQRTTRNIKLSIVFAALSSLMIMLIPLRDVVGKELKQGISTLLASLFWGSLLLEQFFFWLANAGRKTIQSKSFGGRKIVKTSLGLITFGSNREAVICDTVLAITFAATVVLAIMNAKVNLLTMGTLTALILTFNLHCIFNGTTYRYIKTFNKIKKEREKRGNARKIH